MHLSRSSVLVVGTLMIALYWTTSLQAEDAKGKRPSSNAELGRVIEPLIKAHAGDVAVAVRHLESGEEFESNADRPQGTASLIKLPIMIEAYRQAEEGKVSLDETIELRAEDMVPGSGILTTHFSAGTRLSLRDSIRLMIAFSDNTATNLVLEQISIPATCETMRKWGYPETRINSKVYRRDLSIDPARSERYGLGSTTAHDMVDLLAKIHANKILTSAACKEVLAHLYACDDKLKFPALLPKGTKIAHKTGSVAKIRTAAGIIETGRGPVALCVLSENNSDSSWGDDNAGDRLCAEIAKATFDFYSATSTQSATDAVSGATTFAKGASGDLVEALQRTLNARSEPSPSLGVDGDFGPGTEAAVKAFQKSKDLAASGVVDKQTLEALGPLLFEAAPTADPEVINAEELSRKPADDPFGKPAVTCKAWAIGDGKTGEVLWGEQSEEPLDIASTTKIMTAYVIMRYAESHSAVLDEQLVFSQAADKTVGSTAGVRAGESIVVRDLLYGLLLPSGNDASVALAEHFGDRLGNDEDQDKPAYQRFINAMNRAAAELGLKKSHFVNSHGLTAQGHRSTCKELVTLTVAARKLPLFQKITMCRQYGCRVAGPGGYQRNIKWENTNQLLPIEGYTGVKTGTTDAAGACLVSACTYKDRELIVVVLGSVASPARYADARNLYAWAWRNLTPVAAPPAIDTHQ